MKFSEFRQLMEKHNKLIIGFQAGVKVKNWEEEMTNTTEEICNFNRLNREIFRVDLAYLKKKLNKYIKGVLKTGGATASFKVAEAYDEPYLVVEIIELSPTDKTKVTRTYGVGRIVSGEKHNLCVDLLDILDYSFYNSERGVLFQIEGFEDALWQAVEETFNEKVRSRISMLVKTCKRNEERREELQKPGYVMHRIAELDEEDKENKETIAALQAQQNHVD